MELVQGLEGRPGIVFQKGLELANPDLGSLGPLGYLLNHRVQFLLWNSYEKTAVCRVTQLRHMKETAQFVRFLCLRHREIAESIAIETRVLLFPGLIHFLNRNTLLGQLLSLPQLSLSHLDDIVFDPKITQVSQEPDKKERRRRRRRRW